MGNLVSFLKGTTVNNFDKVLYSMTLPENKEREMLFSSEMVDTICEEGHYITYSFAHNLVGEIYMRMRMKKITLEYLVNPRIDPQNYNAKLTGIYISGQLRYRNPTSPEGKIYLVFPDK